MKSSRNIRNYFRIAAVNHRKTLSILDVGIVTGVVNSGVATAQSPSAAPADGKSIRAFHVNVPEAVSALEQIAKETDASGSVVLKDAAKDSLETISKSERASPEIRAKATAAFNSLGGKY